MCDGKTIRIIMNGVTGRMGTNQHLVRSILAIRKQGGLHLRSGDTLVPEPLLLGGTSLSYGPWRTSMA
jgi:hypothetical protein